MSVSLDHVSVLLDHGRFGEAIKYINKYLEEEPEDAHAFYLMGLAQNNMGDLGSALESTHTALGLNPDVSEFHYLQALIYLNQNTTNNIVLTLREVTTIENPYYLFVITSDSTNESKIFTGVDISSNIVRYNEFNIELNSTEDLNDSIINLPLKGFYKYKIYSTSVLNDLDVSNTTELVEEGKVYVDGTDGTEFTYTSSDETKVVYNG